jgi:hypothetical protein
VLDGGRSVFRDRAARRTRAASAGAEAGDRGIRLPSNSVPRPRRGERGLLRRARPTSGTASSTRPRLRLRYGDPVHAGRCTGVPAGRPLRREGKGLGAGRHPAQPRVPGPGAGHHVRIASGRAMAERLGVEPLGDEVILSGKDGRGVDVKAGVLNERQQQDLVGSTPLWSPGRSTRDIPHGRSAALRGAGRGREPQPARPLSTGAPDLAWDRSGTSCRVPLPPATRTYPAPRRGSPAQRHGAEAGYERGSRSLVTAGAFPCADVVSAGTWGALRPLPDTPSGPSRGPRRRRPWP